MDKQNEATASKFEVYTPEQRKADLKNLVDVQMNFGSPHEYHRGMANGLILGYSVAFEPYGAEVKYLEAPKRDEAVASEDIYKRQLEAATVCNHKKELQIIGLREQVQTLKVAISKLKAMRKELRSIIDERD